MIGSVRPWFVENVFPDTSMGSCHVALAVCGATYVTVTSNVSDALFPLASVAVQVTVVVPVPTCSPLAGVHATSGDGSTMSVAVGVA